VTDRGLGAALVAAAGVAALGLAGMLSTDGPYVSFGEINPWSVVYAIGVFALLIGAPFALHRRIGEGRDRDRRWELAVVSWGGGALVVGAVLTLVAVLSDGALGAAAVIGLVECGLVVGAVVLLMLTTG
jgi:hypothetical protein